MSFGDSDQLTEKVSNGVVHKKGHCFTAHVFI